jgi:hypothetical protein
VAFVIPENLRTRRDVPPGVARLARALQEGLDDQATLWYEPLFDRAGERPDLVVLVPDAGILVIEVLESKANAIRGARNGALLVAGDAAQLEVPTPLARAEAFAVSLEQRIATEPRVGPHDRLPVRAAGAFPYLSREEAEAKGIDGAVALDRCLLRANLEAGVSSGEEFRRLVAELLDAPLRDPLSPEAEKAHRSLIHPDTVIGSPQLPLPVSGVETDGDDLKVLDRRQEALAKALGQGHHVIRGVAGSGKTLVLSYRARLLAEHFPHHRVLVTCFNRSLAGVLRRQLRYRNVTVATLDSLMTEARRRTGTDVRDYREHSRDELAQLALDALDEQPDAVARFDHVLVDEAQDFPTPALRFAVRLLTPESDSLLVMADSAQNIYRTKFTWKAAGINAVGRTRKLDTSYRNTREILEYAHEFVVGGGDLRVDNIDDPEDETAVILPRFSVRSGPLPLFLLLPTPWAEVATIAEHCQKHLDEGVEPGEIAVLYGTQVTSGFNWPRAIRSVFAERNIPLFWLNDPDHRANRDHVGEDHSRVVLSTIHSAKGLEFRHVVLCGYLDDRPPEDAVVNRRLVYVGMTRATHELVLTASGQHAYIADLDR